MDLFISNVTAVFTQWVWPILLFVFGLGVVVFVHELGHFLVAKAAGIRVKRFALGFGPRICGYRGKETDYSIMLFPLGGYIKMAGQEDFAPLEDDKGEPDPRAYSSKSVGARFAVISAGVIMNVIFAAIMFVVIGMIGKPGISPTIGDTAPGSPARTAKIMWLDDSDQPMDVKAPGYPKDQPETPKPGDRMTRIEGPGLMLWLLGKDIECSKQVLMQAALSDISDKYTLYIERTVGDKVLRGKASIGVKMSPSPSGSGSELPLFGFRRPASTGIARREDFVLDKNDLLKADDRIVAINGHKIEHHWDIKEFEKTLLGRTVEITVERTLDGTTRQVKIPSVRPTVRSDKVFYRKDGGIIRGEPMVFDTKSTTYTLWVGQGTEQKVSIEDLANVQYDSDSGLRMEVLDVLGMIPRLQIGAVTDGSPAHQAGLQAGDIIVRYGNHTAPTHLKLKELNKKFAADGADIVVMRNGKVLPPTAIRPKLHHGDARIGITIEVDMEHLVVADIRENSPVDKIKTAGSGDKIASGDVIKKVNEQDVSTWSDLLTALNKLQGKEVVLTISRGDHRFDNTIPLLSRETFDKSDYATSILTGPWGYKHLMAPKISRGPLAALAWGCKETMFFITTSYATIRSLVMRTVSPKELSGPLGIGSMAVMAGRKSLLDFAYFMAMISVSLAVVNFLPFPVVDGGHALFLLIEKIRGKPLSIRVMNVVQMVGLAMILMVFLFVTWQDVSRIWRG